jgi:hypothetical protein
MPLVREKRLRLPQFCDNYDFPAVRSYLCGRGTNDRRSSANIHWGFQLTGTVSKLNQQPTVVLIDDLQNQR